MQRIIFIICFVIYGCFLINNAQSLRRSDKDADFFVPDGVFQADNKQEKLPSVQQMRYQGEQAPVIYEMEQEKITQQKIKIETEKRRLTQQKKEDERKKLYLEKKQSKAEKIIPLSNEPDKKIIIPVQENNTQFSEYNEILIDYQKDLENISQGLPVNNPRLEKMLNDFNNEVHTVE